MNTYETDPEMERRRALLAYAQPPTQVVPPEVDDGPGPEGYTNGRFGIEAPDASPRELVAQDDVPDLTSTLGLRPRRAAPPRRPAVAQDMQRPQVMPDGSVRLPSRATQEANLARQHGTPESRMSAYMLAHPDQFEQGSAGTILTNKIASPPNRDPFREPPAPVSAPLPARPAAPLSTKLVAKGDIDETPAGTTAQADPWSDVAGAGERLPPPTDPQLAPQARRFALASRPPSPGGGSDAPSSESSSSTTSFGAPNIAIQRFIDSFGPELQGKKPDFSATNALIDQAKQAEESRASSGKAALDFVMRKQERTAADARAAAALTETSRHNLATEGKTTPEKTVIDPIAKERALLGLSPQERNTLGVGPKAAPAPRVDHFAESEANKDRRARAALAAKRDAPPPAITPSAKATGDRHTEDQKLKQRAALGKVVQEQGDIGGLLMELEKVAPGSIYGDPKNLPGAGGDLGGRADRAVTGISGGTLGSNKSTELYAVQERLKAMVGKATSGMALNPGEMSSLAAFMGSKALAPPDQFARTLNIIRKGLHRNVAGRGQQFKVGPYAVHDEFFADPANASAIRDNDPVLFRDMAGASAPAPAETVPSALVTLIDPKTGKVYEGIPADKAEQYVKSKGLVRQ